MSKIKHAYTMYLGADPEFFFMKNGEVVGAEKILPKDGVVGGRGSVIIDGVQAEMNPTAHYCREYMSAHIANCFASLREHMNNKGHKVDVSFDPLVPISKKNLDALSDKARVFGCTPSFNAYLSDNPMIIPDSSKYYFRPAGGHLHLGHQNQSELMKVLADVKTIVPLLDIIVGNTFVLLDRHEGNVERRKVYGRAGEYRTPAHGLEYRTLSNVWLKSYPLMSFAFGLARLAVDIAESSTKEKNFAKMIMDSVNRDDIIKAINNNDFELALKNFAKVRKVLEDIIPDGTQSLNKSNIPQFLYFVGEVQKNGLDKYCPKNPFEWWAGVGIGDISRGYGWENYLAITVADRMSKTTKVINTIKKSVLPNF